MGAVTKATRDYWLSTVLGWAEDRLPAPQFDECKRALGQDSEEGDLRAALFEFAKIYHWHGVNLETEPDKAPAVAILWTGPGAPWSIAEKALGYVVSAEGGVRWDVFAFALLMERELRQHDDRPGWKDAHPSYLLRRLRQELEELAMVVHEERPAGEIGSEAADVANFALMVADVAGALKGGE